MTKYKGRIILAEKPAKQIEWFTKKFDKEIGALGIGKLKDGDLIVEKLFFPKQTVNGAHVHFKPEDWGPILAEMDEEEWKHINFYWHKHPTGMPGASQGDEEDTFDVFMDESSGRKIFGFLQTCKKTGGGIDYEARIEMRKPIWASIDAELITKHDLEIEKECEKIIETRITSGTLGATSQTGVKVIYKKEDDKEDDDAMEEDKDSWDFKSYFGVRLLDGAVQITHSIDLKEFMEELLADEDIDKMIGRKSIIQNTSLCVRRLEPKGGKLKELLSILKTREEEFNEIYDDETIEETVEKNIENAAKEGMKALNEIDHISYNYRI